MANWVTLTRSFDNKPIQVNMDRAVYFGPQGLQTVVKFEHEVSVAVNESMEDVTLLTRAREHAAR